MPILKNMEVIGVQVSPNIMACPQTYNDHRRMRAEKQTFDVSKLATSCRRAEKLAEKDVFKDVLK